MRKKFYITTAIAYTNASPHIGHALEFIQADVLAKYHRSKNEDVFFLTGTDEHGQKVYEAAKKSGKSPQEFTDEIGAEFKSLCQKLEISNDYFIRTTDKEKHWPGVAKLWKKIEENGDLEKRKYKGLYCVGCEEFKTKKVLIDGNKCPIHLKEVEIIEEENWFFKLSKYSQALKEKIKSGELDIVPESRKNEILALLNEGLEDISFSRIKEKLSWGIPVPGDERQIIYVWGDALPNYITGIGYGSNTGELFDKFWPADIHLIGKDILRFHAAIWPAMLLSAKLPIPKTIMTHGFITSNGHKMSKSLGNVISPFELIEKYGAEAVRYYLLKEIPTLDDGDLTEEKLKERYNSDLANGLGNFSARVLTIATKIDLKDCQPKEEIILKIKEVESAVNKKIDEFKLNEALATIWGLIGYGDSIVNNEKPWENPENKKDVLAGLVLLLKKSAELLLPFLPQTADKILTSIQNNQKGENLFPRLNSL